MLSDLENELPEPEPGAKRRKPKADVDHLRRARADLRGPGGPVAPLPPPADDEPFLPPPDPWIGDVWRSTTRREAPIVDVVDVVGNVVFYEPRGPVRKTARLAIPVFVKTFKPEALAARPAKAAK